MVGMDEGVNTGTGGGGMIKQAHQQHQHQQHQHQHHQWRDEEQEDQYSKRKWGGVPRSGPAVEKVSEAGPGDGAGGGCAGDESEEGPLPLAKAADASSSGGAGHERAGGEMKRRRHLMSVSPTGSDSESYTSQDNEEEDDEDAEDRGANHARRHGRGGQDEEDDEDDSSEVAEDSDDDDANLHEAVHNWAVQQRANGARPIKLLRLISAELGVEPPLHLLSRRRSSAAMDAAAAGIGARGAGGGGGGRESEGEDEKEEEEEKKEDEYDDDAYLDDCNEEAGAFTEAQAQAWALVKRLMSVLQRHRKGRPRRLPRRKLDSVNTLDDVVHLIRHSQKVIVLTGAGLSVSCGIPDFRSENGIYSMLGEYNLPSPQAMFDIRFFSEDPKPFFKFCQSLLPGSYQPSSSHRFLKLLDAQGKLLRNYSQNIDGLEKQAGVTANRVHQCHGHFDTATCQYCKRGGVRLERFRHDIVQQRIPMCDACGHPEGILKPDIVFFGEALGGHFSNLLQDDLPQVDLVLVIGTSLQVAPVNQIVGLVKPDVPQVLINREVVGQPHSFDVELLGDCDAVVEELCRRLGSEWTEGLGVGSSPSVGGGTKAAVDGAAAAAAADKSMSSSTTPSPRSPLARPPSPSHSIDEDGKKRSGEEEEEQGPAVAVEEEVYHGRDRDGSHPSHDDDDDDDDGERPTLSPASLALRGDGAAARACPAVPCIGREKKPSPTSVATDAPTSPVFEHVATGRYLFRNGKIPGPLSDSDDSEESDDGGGGGKYPREDRDEDEEELDRQNSDAKEEQEKRGERYSLPSQDGNRGEDGGRGVKNGSDAASSSGGVPSSKAVQATARTSSPGSSGSSSSRSSSSSSTTSAMISPPQP